MKKLSGLVAVCVMVALVAVTSATVSLEGLPDPFYAGSENTLIYTIHAGEPGPIKVDFSISNDTDKIGWSETRVQIEAEGNLLSCTEYKPCHYNCEEYDGAKTSVVKVMFSAAPNLKPQEYVINFTAKYKGEQVTVTRRAGGRSYNPDIDKDGINSTDEILSGTDWRNPCDPNPYNEACYAIGGARPTPTPSPTPTPEVTPGATATQEETPTPMSGRPKPLKDYIWLWYLGLGGIISALVVYLLWRRWKQNQ